MKVQKTAAQFQVPLNLCHMLPHLYSFHLDWHIQHILNTDTKTMLVLLLVLPEQLQSSEDVYKGGRRLSVCYRMPRCFT